MNLRNSFDWGGKSVEGAETKGILRLCFHSVIYRKAGRGSPFSGSYTEELQVPHAVQELQSPSFPIGAQLCCA